MTKEEYYDAHIAPKLLAIMHECQAQGMNMCASVEYNTETGCKGWTEFIDNDHCSIHQKLVHWAGRARGNVDGFLLALCKHATQYGHSSAYLYRLGVPSEPEVKS